MQSSWTKLNDSAYSFSSIYGDIENLSALPNPVFVSCLLNHISYRISKFVANTSFPDIDMQINCETWSCNQMYSD